MVDSREPFLWSDPMQVFRAHSSETQQLTVQSKRVEEIGRIFSELCKILAKQKKKLPDNGQHEQQANVEAILYESGIAECTQVNVLNSL